jgi:predicted membrane-bound spermidine synthase
VIIRAVAYGYFGFRDKPLRVFLGGFTKEEASLVNAEIPLVVNGVHVRNFGRRIKELERPDV